MTRSQILDEAKRCVCEDREKSHGDPEITLSAIGMLWGSYLDIKYPLPEEVARNGIPAKDVAVMMALMKIARSATGNGSHEDNWVDLAGYAALGGEMEQRENEFG